MKGQTQTAKILSNKYNIELNPAVFERLVDSLDQDGKKWFRTAPVAQIADWASGVLCNTEPDRNGNY